MEDNQHGLRNRAPMKTDQRVVLLAPQNESYAGPQYDHNPVSAGGVPADPLGYFPEGSTVPDREFQGQWPSRGPQTIGNDADTEFISVPDTPGRLIPEPSDRPNGSVDKHHTAPRRSRKLKAQGRPEFLK